MNKIIVVFLCLFLFTGSVYAGGISPQERAIQQEKLDLMDEKLKRIDEQQIQQPDGKGFAIILNNLFNNEPASENEEAPVEQKTGPSYYELDKATIRLQQIRCKKDPSSCK